MANKKHKDERFSLMDILGGKTLQRLIAGNARMVLMLSVLIVFFISTRYSCTLKIKQIDILQQELKETRMEALSVSVELAKHSRRSQIEQRASQAGLGLVPAPKPSYMLHK